MTNKEAENKITEIESLAKERFIKDADWHNVMNTLEQDEKEELDIAYNKLYKADYPVN